MAIHLDRGHHAEQLALHFLEKQGLKLLDRNYRCRLGEIDLIMQENQVIVFVEVRLRGKTSFARACESITPKKQRRLIHTTHYYLMSHGKQYQKNNLRFDAVFLDDQHKIDWIKNAFGVQY
jgi:putative endonuclease